MFFIIQYSIRDLITSIRNANALSRWNTNVFTPSTTCSLPPNRLARSLAMSKALGLVSSLLDTKAFQGTVKRLHPEPLLTPIRLIWNSRSNADVGTSEYIFIVIQFSGVITIPQFNDLIDSIFQVCPTVDALGIVVHMNLLVTGGASVLALCRGR